METSGFEVATWNQIYRMLLNQSEKIRRSLFDPQMIIGIARGGWLPARVLSDLLENPNVASVRTEFYTGTVQDKSRVGITQQVSAAVAGKRVLLVDDVSDTGLSLKLVREHVLEEGALDAKIATLYYKPWSTVKPDYYEKETTLWIVFPWEAKETIRKIVETCQQRGTTIEAETTKLRDAGLSGKVLKRILKDTLEEKTC